MNDTSPISPISRNARLLAKRPKRRLRKCSRRKPHGLKQLGPKESLFPCQRSGPRFIKPARPSREAVEDSQRSSGDFALLSLVTTSGPALLGQTVTCSATPMSVIESNVCMGLRTLSWFCDKHRHHPENAGSDPNPLSNSDSNFSQEEWNNINAKKDEDFNVLMPLH